MGRLNLSHSTDTYDLGKMMPLTKTKLNKCWARKGVSEIISVTLLILIAVAVGTTFYLAAKAAIDAQYKRLSRDLERVNNIAQLQVSVVDAYYNSTDSTIHVFVYVSNDSAPVTIDTAYINKQLVPKTDLIQGFGTQLPSGVNELIIRYALTAGNTYEIILTGPNEVKLVTYVTT